MVRLLSLHDLPRDGSAAIGTSGIMLMLLMIVATLSIFSMITFVCGDSDGKSRPTGASTAAAAAAGAVALSSSAAGGHGGSAAGGHGGSACGGGGGGGGGC